MAQAGGIRAGKAYVEMYGQDDGLKSTLKNDETAVESWGKRIGGIGSSVGATFSKGLAMISAAAIVVGGAAAAGFAIAIAAAKSFAENADRLSHLSKTGITQEDAKRARELRVAFSTLSTSIQAAWANIGAAVAPVLKEILNGLSIIVQGITRWLAEWRTQNAETFAALFKDFKTAWGGIVAAISKGDLATAAEIAWLTIKIKFFEVVKAMGGNWNTFYTKYLETISLIGDAWDVLWTRVIQGFDFAFTKLRNGWKGTQTFLAKGIAVLLGMMEGKTAAQRQEVIDEITAEHEREMKKSNDALGERNTKREEELQGRITKRSKELADALAALPANDDERIKTLRKELEALSLEAKEGTSDKPQFYAPRNIATAGTFNAAAIRGVSGSGPLDKIAKNTKDTADNTKTLVKKKNNGPVFGGGK